MEWAAVDTLVKLSKGNVDAAHTSGKQLNTSWRTAAVDTSVANTISNVDTVHWLKTAERLQLWICQL